MTQQFTVVVERDPESGWLVGWGSCRVTWLLYSGAKHG
jgi:hypothetical protein